MHGNPAAYAGCGSYGCTRKDMAARAAGDERTTQAVLLKRKNIIRQITVIRPQAGKKNLKEMEIPQFLFQLAREIVLDPETGPKFKKVAVYDLLLGDLHRRTTSDVTLDKAGPVLD